MKQSGLKGVNNPSECLRTFNKCSGSTIVATMEGTRPTSEKFKRW